MAKAKKVKRGKTFEQELLAVLGTKKKVNECLLITVALRTIGATPDQSLCVIRCLFPALDGRPVLLRMPMIGG